VAYRSHWVTGRFVEVAAGLKARLSA